MSCAKKVVNNCNTLWSLVGTATSSGVRRNDNARDDWCPGGVSIYGKRSFITALRERVRKTSLNYYFLRLWVVFRTIIMSRRARGTVRQRSKVINIRQD